MRKKLFQQQKETLLKELGGFSRRQRSEQLKMARKVLGLPKFNRDEIFKAVDESNKRFYHYTPAQRRKFYDSARGKSQTAKAR